MEFLDTRQTTRDTRKKHISNFRVSCVLGRASIGYTPVLVFSQLNVSEIINLRFFVKILTTLVVKSKSYPLQQYLSSTAFLDFQNSSVKQY